MSVDRVPTQIQTASAVLVDVFSNRCGWYFNDVLNFTTNGTINGSTIL